MLTHLHIRDLAIVESMELDIAAGLTVLTGETGAGKSIIVDALTLISGARAGADQIRAAADKAEIAATFDIRRAPAALRELLETQAIEADDELLVRRIINRDGRSRALLNGQAVPVQLLRDLLGLLLEVHGQHEFQTLVKPATQRELLDGYGKLQPQTEQVRTAHRHWLGLLNRLLELESQLRDRESRLELLKFQVSELNALALKAGEVAELHSESTRLGNRSRLSEATQLAAQLLYEGEANTAHAQLARAQTALRPLLSVDPALEPVMPLLDEASIRITEAARSLARYAEGLETDNARQATVEKRLAAAEEIARKHRVLITDLPAHHDALQSELATLETADQDLGALRKQQSDALGAYRSLAIELSKARNAVARTFGKELTARMQTLGMAGGRFEVEVSPHASNEPQPHGLDQVEFRVSANPGQPLRPLAKVASGGELARLSLAVQVACSGNEQRCMVFDEVDAGIGGAVAEIVGKELHALGKQGQALCVTHLPQVAAQGHHHLRVLKMTDGKTTRTQLTELTGNERVNEIARMLGGTQITAKALEHAREMLQADDQKSGDTAKIKVGKPRRA
jgi:DNA repair protein RecN (Recombination protein N)